MRYVVGILLAAGLSRRFGANKLLAPLADGTPVVAATAHRLVGAVPEAVAVVRPGDAELTACLAAQGMRIVECMDAEKGMGHSLASAIAAADADAWLVALGDMPYVKPSTLDVLVARLASGSALVAPAHAGRRGHPVGFSAKWRDELLALTGDVGARDLLMRQTRWLELCDVDDPGVLHDIDTPEELMAPIVSC